MIFNTPNLYYVSKVYAKFQVHRLSGGLEIAVRTQNWHARRSSKLAFCTSSVASNRWQHVQQPVPMPRLCMCVCGRDALTA